MASMRAESAASTLEALVPSSDVDSAGWSVREPRYFSAESTSGPVTVESYEGRAGLGAVSRKPARAAAERRRACWAAAVSASRCFVSAAEEVVVRVGRPVVGLMTVWVEDG